MNLKQQYELLVKEYASDLYRMAVWLCKDQTLADDLVQETFTRAWKSLHSLKDPKSAKAWLITILRREHARYYERKRFETLDIDDVSIEAPLSSQPEHQALHHHIRQTLLKLDDKYRIPLLLQTFGGLSCEEIAIELNSSKSAVMTQLFRARQKLKSLLEKDQIDSGVVHELY